MNKQFYNDVSDNLVIIANNNLSHDYSSGVHMISTPLDLYTTNIEETFNGLDDNFPSYWSVYDELGNNMDYISSDGKALFIEYLILKSLDTTNTLSVDDQKMFENCCKK